MSRDDRDTVLVAQGLERCGVHAEASRVTAQRLHYIISGLGHLLDRSLHVRHVLRYGIELQADLLLCGLASRKADHRGNGQTDRSQRDNFFHRLKIIKVESFSIRVRYQID